MLGRRWVGLTNVLGIAAVLGLTGCTTLGVACPTFGWVNELTVTLDGGNSRVVDIKLCIADACAPVDGGYPPGELSQVALAEQDGSTDTWVFTTGMSTPSQFTVRVYDADGIALSGTPVTPEWVRIGGSEECGGPGEATVTVLHN